MRPEGRPSLEAVARTAAFGSGSFAASTSWNHFSNWRNGSRARSFSALHRLRMDEVWMFGAGDPAELVQIDARSKACRSCILGPEVADGHRAQVVVPAGTWQGARLAPGGSRGWALFSCLVSPAWDETDFELGEREALVREYPAHAGTIRALTRGRPADAF